MQNVSWDRAEKETAAGEAAMIKDDQASSKEDATSGVRQRTIEYQTFPLSLNLPRISKGTPHESRTPQ